MNKSVFAKFKIKLKGFDASYYAKFVMMCYNFDDR
jgi:hypothetical protein